MMSMAVTAISATLVIVTVGIVNVREKSSVRVGVVLHHPHVAAWFLQGVFTCHFLAY